MYRYNLRAMGKAVHVDNRTRIVLDQIESRGYAVTVHYTSSWPRRTIIANVEMQAAALSCPEDRYISRIRVDEGDDIEYRAACLLAEMVGAWLDG